MQHLNYTYDFAGNITTVENTGDYLYGNIGGAYEYSFIYDDTYRLTRADGEFTPYNQQPISYRNDLTYSASGNILEKDVDGTMLINGGTTYVSYQNVYDYTGRPHTVSEAGDYTYDWDLNGNLKRRLMSHNDRYFCWDEENRLSAVRDVSDLSQSSLYIYDAGGERAWKLTGEEMLTQVNGQTVSSNIYFEKTLYTGPYLVMTERDYTKHYYIEGERVCSKIGGGFGLASVQPADSVLDFIYSDLEHFGEELHTMCWRHLECVDYEGEWELYKKLDPAGNVEDSLENLQYFYHSDHLGSAAVISFTSGRAYQHLQYFPYGELFVSQRNSSFDSRYKFSAKELDNETGYSYFGARYYDSDLSSWLSVDPLSNKYPSLSPYAYCANNPIILIDTDGRKIVPISEGENNKEAKAALKSHFENTFGSESMSNIMLAMIDHKNEYGKYAFIQNTTGTSLLKEFDNAIKTMNVEGLTRKEIKQLREDAMSYRYAIINDETKYLYISPIKAEIDNGGVEFYPISGNLNFDDLQFSFDFDLDGPFKTKTIEHSQLISVKFTAIRTEGPVYLNKKTREIYHYSLTKEENDAIRKAILE